MDFLFNDYSLNIVVITGIFIILSLSLNLINGLCGQFSLGHAGFYGIGAYGSAYFSVYYSLPIPDYLNMVVAMIVGFLIASFCGLLVGGVCLRLRGDYLAIATLGFGEILRIIFVNTDQVGGPRGFTGIPKWADVYWVYVCVILVTIIMMNLKRSAFGRAIISIREDEIAAENMGVNLFGYKLFSFSIGAGIAGVAGALYAHTQSFLHPDNFNFMWSVIILVMIILGGLGSVTGAIVGAIILTIFPEALRFLGKDVSTLRMTIYAILLIVLMLLRPYGIFGSFEWGEKRRLKKKLLALQVSENKSGEKA
jgi:branched-chain amino acid transport system permease protein